MTEPINNPFAKAPATGYDDITTLDGITHIRTRPGMYVGDTQSNEFDSAPMNLFREAAGNCGDEFLGGHATTIWVTLHKNGDIQVLDNGRGIPFSWNEKQNRSNLEVALGVPNSGAKYDKGDGKAFKVSIGLNGIGMKAVTALSEVLIGMSFREGKQATAIFRKGFIEQKTHIVDYVNRDLPSDFPGHGTCIQWRLDQSLLPFKYKVEHIKRYLQEMAYLNAGLKIYFCFPVEVEGHPDAKDEVCYHEPDGIFSLQRKLTASKEVLLEFPPMEGTDTNDNSYQIALSILEDSSEEYHPFVNGGAIEVASTPVVAMRQAFAHSILKYMTEQYTLPKKMQKEPPTTSDVRSGVCAVIKLLHTDPAFSSQTKTKLISTDISSFLQVDLKEKFLSFFLKNPAKADLIVKRIIAHAEAREAAERARQAALKRSSTGPRVKKEFNLSLNQYTPPLSDEAELNSLYLFEGESASSVLVDAAKEKDPDTGKLYKEHTGILALKGMSLNSLEKSLREALQNAEMATLVEVSGLNKDDPSDLSGLNFGKFIIASDEDSGGKHIAILLVTFFATHFPEVIKQGLLYRVHTPLYEIVNTKTKEINFVYADEDLDEKLKDFGFSRDRIHKDFTQKRNKGLGELGHKARLTLVKNPRLQPLQYEEVEKLVALLHIFSGSDYIQTRKDLIFQHGLEVEA